ncbi:unnamed protein product [Paramecium octaurelia]|uniref:TLDc domain-containing protein n=1 Tax=Paramecium octaurelia TaxID=43137 RepID=A0A8S1WB64_PAROT|nr:unnamed protein product [Paramecium octaurelia]
MQTFEIEKRICQVHKLEIVVVDLKSQTRIDDKYLCTRCLAERVDKENMALLNEATEMIQSMKTQTEKLAKEENVLRLNNLKQLQSSIKSYKNQIKIEIEKLLQLIDQQVEQIQFEIESKESKLEFKNYDEEIQILSKNYIGNFNYNIPKQLTYKEKDLALFQIIYESLQSQQKSQNFNQIMESIELIKSSVPINQSANINQMPAKEFDQHKTPYLNQICNKHNKEIIMLNINQTEPEFGRLACVECIEENPIQYISLKEANKRWNSFMGQSEDLISKHNFKREQQFNMVAQEVKQLKDYYNEQLSEMIKNIDLQLTKNNSDIQDFIKLENKKIFELDEKQVENMINLLSQKDQNKKILEQQEKQDRLDQLFYQDIKYKLDSLIKHDLLCKQQLIKILTLSDSNQININDIQEDKISPEIHEFISKCQLQDQYLNIFNESVNLQIELLKEQETLKQKGQINQIIDQEGKADAELPRTELIKTYYQQFEINSKKMEKLIMVDETEQNLIEMSSQKEQLQLQIQDEKEERKLISQKIQNLEENLNTNFSTLDQKIIKQEQLSQQIDQQLQQQKLELGLQINDASNKSQLSLAEVQSSISTDQYRLTCQINDLKSELSMVNKDMKNFRKSSIIDEQLKKLEEEFEIKFQAQNEKVSTIIEENQSQFKKQEQESECLQKLIEAQNNANLELKKEISEIQVENIKQFYQVANKMTDQSQQINNIIESFEQSQKQQITHEEYLKPKIEIQFKKLKQIPIVKPKLLRDDYWIKVFYVLQEKSKKSIKNSSLIFSTKNGLKVQSFWKEVNNKDNLLMIFQSKSDYIFGAYSPCKWVSNLNTYVQDDTLSSFIFSQTHNQIYPLKQDRKQYAIYCKSGYGPTFGGGSDFYINANFSDGYSNLGHSYQFDQYKNESEDPHLFGQNKPEIKECEIYQISFI